MKARGAVLSGLAAALLAAAACALLVNGDSDSWPDSPQPSAVVAESKASSLDSTAIVAFDEPTDTSAVAKAEPLGATSETEPPHELPEVPPPAPGGVLTGSVLDDRGAPVLWPELLLSQGATQRVLEAGQLNLDPNGQFRVELPPGPWSLQARARDHSCSEKRSVQVTASGEAPPVDLVLTRQGILRGSVLLASEWLAKLPLTFQVVIEVAPDDPPTAETIEHEPEVHVRRQELWVGPDCTFELRGCARGLYRLRLEYPLPGGNWVSGWTQTWLDPGDVREGIQLACLEQAAVSVQARILDERGDPVEGARVEAAAHLAVSDARGQFELRGLDLGEHSVVVAHAGYAPSQRRFEFVGEPLSLDLQLETKLAPASR